MGKYKIRIDYTTGNSFGSEDTFDYIELTWDNIDNAKENLQRIKDHYEMYQGLNNYYSTRKMPTREELMDQNKDKEWFVNKPKLFCISTNCHINEKDKKKVGDGNWEYRTDEYYAERCLYLKADNGNKLQLSAFWCGYFESLNSAEIEIDNSDMKIIF